jgi:hypothetical protein
MSDFSSLILPRCSDVANPRREALLDIDPNTQFAEIQVQRSCFKTYLTTKFHSAWFKACFAETCKFTARNQVRKSHEVLRQTGFETTLPGQLRRSQSGAQSKKPRVLRGLMLPLCLLSRLEVFVLAEEEGFEPSVVLPLRLISSQVHSTTLPPLLSICRSRDSSRAFQGFLGTITAALRGAMVIDTTLPANIPPSTISNVAVRSCRVMTMKLFLPRTADTTVQPCAG